MSRLGSFMASGVSWSLRNCASLSNPLRHHRPDTCHGPDTQRSIQSGPICTAKAAVHRPTAKSVPPSLFLGGLGESGIGCLNQKSFLVQFHAQIRSKSAWQWLQPRGASTLPKKMAAQMCGLKCTAHQKKPPEPTNQAGKTSRWFGCSSCNTKPRHGFRGNVCDTR